MKKWFKRLKNQKGMTLVELLAVVVILGIVAAIAVPAVGNIIDRSKNDAHVSNALLIINAAKLGDVSGELLESDWTSGSITINKLVTEKLLDSIPANPSDKGKTYDSGSIVTKSGGKYSITLYKDDGGTGVGSVEVNATEAQLNGASITSSNGDKIPGR